jgi:crotonobetaine/carnitine-CoA ligase
VPYGINIPEEKKKQFEQIFDAKIINSYGLTEATSPVTMSPIYGRQGYPSVGKPLFDYNVCVVDDSGKPLPIGETGEIAISGEPGKTIFKEYYGMEEKTEGTFKNGFLLTGDYGRFDDDGFLYFVDRKKNIIKTRGKNVSESEVESILSDHPKVEGVAVIGISDEIYDEKVLALIKLKDSTVSSQQIIEFAEKELTDFKVPDKVNFVENLPRTGIGKIKKGELRSRYGEK